MPENVGQLRRAGKNQPVTNARLATSIESATQSDAHAAAVRRDFHEVEQIYAHYGAFLTRHPEAIELLNKRKTTPKQPPHAGFYQILNQIEGIDAEVPTES